MTDDIVIRLHRALVDEMKGRDHPGTLPVKVSELYQDLIPYRSLRSELDLDLNADYEHALLRLLAGERDLLRLEPAEARDELRREVDAPYPFVGLFRKFASCDVWVSMTNHPESSESEEEPAAAPSPDEVDVGVASPVASDAADGSGSSVSPVEAGSGSPAHEEPADLTAAATPEGPGDTRAGTPKATPKSPPMRVETRGATAIERAPVRLHQDSPEDPTSELTVAGEACAFCEDALPPGRRVRFCPHCGGDQRLRPCPRCEAILENDWRYCISCGHEVL